jgi:predicted MFS family arabinose efflux permease
MLATDRDTKKIPLILMVPLSVFTTDMYLSSFNEIASCLHASPFSVQLSLSIYFIGMAFFTLFSTLFAESIGSKKMLISGLLSYLLGTFLTLTTSSITFFIVGRFLQSFGGASTSVLTRSMAAKSPSTLTYMFASMSLSIMIAPLFGSYLLTSFGWRANFAFMGILSLLYLLMTFSFSEETTKPKVPLNPSLALTEIKTLFSIPEYFRHTLFVIFAWGGFLSFISGSPFFLLHHFQEDPKSFAILYSLVMTGFILGNLLCRKLKHVFPLSLTAIGLGSGLLLAFLVWPAKPLFITASCLYLFGTGLILPFAQIKATRAPEKSHYAFGVMYFAMMLFGSLCGITIQTYSHIFGMIALVMALIGLTQIALFFKLKESLLPHKI